MRPDPKTIANTTKALLTVLRRCDPEASLNLQLAADARLFADTYVLAATIDDGIELGARVADLIAEREAKRAGK